MERTKVVYIISRIDYALAFDWVDLHLDKTKFDLSFIFLNPTTPKLHQELLNRGVASYYIPFNSKLDYPRVAWKLFLLFKKIKPDVVHVHLIDACLTALPIAFLLGVKKRIYTRHHSTYHFDYFPHAVKYDRLMNRLATTIIAISKNVEAILIEREGASREKVVVIHHGFDLSKFTEVDEESVQRLALKYNPLHKKPVVGVISRFTEWKGVQYIIPAFQKLLVEFPDSLLVLANASGDREKDILDQLTILPKESYVTIKFEREVHALYHLFDVFVHVPIDSHSEAFGQTYIEALAAGVPSIFTLSGIASEIIHDKKNAIVVDYKTSEQIYEGIKLILADDILKDRLIKTGDRKSTRLNSSHSSVSRMPSSA